MTDPIPGEIVALEIDASDVLNKVANHSGEFNTSGWVATGLGTVIAVADLPATTPGTYAGNAIRVTSSNPNNQFVQIVSPMWPVVAGHFVGVVVNAGDGVASADVRLTAELLFYDADLMIVTSSARWRQVVKLGSDPDNTLVTLDLDQSVVVPPGAVLARAKITHAIANAPSGAPLPAGWVGYVACLMAVTSPQAAAVKNVAFTTLPAWQNILGGGESLRFGRGGAVEGVTDNVDAAILTAVLSDPAVDPTVNPRVRPGRLIRVMGKKSDGSSAPLYTGRLTAVDVDYALTKGPDPTPPRVTLTASDAVAALRGISAPFNYAGSFAAKVKALVPAGVALIADAGAAGTVKTSREDNATLWDQLLLARNSTINGKVWVTPDGTVKAVTWSTTVPAATFTDDPDESLSYLDIQLNFGSRALVNSLLVHRTNTDELPDGNKTYGPYINAASVGNWGTVAATVDIIDGVPSTLAADYLKKYAVPTVFPDSLTFDALKLWAAGVAWLDVYSAVRVVFAPAGLDRTVYVIGIEHDITPISWRVTFRFRPLDTLASDTISNPAAGANTGPADVLPPAVSSVKFAGAAAMSTNLTTTTTAADAPGLTMTVRVDTSTEFYVVTADLDIATTSATASTFVAELLVDGVAQGRQLLLNLPVNATRFMAGQTWLITGLTAGDHLIKLTARSTGPGHIVRAPHSAITITEV